MRTAGSFFSGEELEDSCLLPEAELAADVPTDLTAFKDLLVDVTLVVAPLVLPVLAALYFENLLDGLDSTLQFLAIASRGDIQLADGGLTRTSALLPTITGIVLPCVSFALGTLTATTISTLRARQVELRTQLNAESCLIRSILTAMDSMFPADTCAAERAKIALLLRQYCSRVLVESRAGIDLQQLARQGAANSELDAINTILHSAEGSYEGEGFRYNTRTAGPRFQEVTEFTCQMKMARMQEVRSERLAILHTTYPAVHWLALVLLGASIVFGFLLVADQQTLLFLAPLQLRLLFSVIIGTLTSTACICVDLNDPFRGAFRITPSSEQLLLIRDLVAETLCGPGGPPTPTPPPMARGYDGGGSKDGRWGGVG